MKRTVGLVMRGKDRRTFKVERGETLLVILGAMHEHVSDTPYAVEIRVGGKLIPKTEQNHNYKPPFRESVEITQFVGIAAFLPLSPVWRL